MARIIIGVVAAGEWVVQGAIQAEAGVLHLQAGHLANLE
jgi:hypothetical protein